MPLKNNRVMTSKEVAAAMGNLSGRDPGTPEVRDDRIAFS